MADAIIEGSEVYKVHAAELAAMQKNEKENEGDSNDLKQVTPRRMRERRDRDHDNNRRERRRIAKPDEKQKTEEPIKEDSTTVKE